VSSIGKLLRLAVCPALVLAAAGCAGINASKSVSPMDALPFLLKANPAPAQPDRILPAEQPVKQVAQI
jgi:hypothetical protein